MSTWRTSKEQGKTPVTRIDNRALTDSRLSFEARGILAYLLAKPDDCEVCLKAIEREAPDGREAIRSAFRELEEFGYIIRAWRQAPDGKMRGWKSLVFEHPSLKAERTDGKLL